MNNGKDSPVREEPKRGKSESGVEGGTEEKKRDRRESIIEESVRVVRKVARQEIMGLLKKMKGGKAVGMTGIVVEVLKAGCIGIIE